MDAPCIRICEPMSGSRTFYINRAPALTLWAAVVAERLGLFAYGSGAVSGGNCDIVATFCRRFLQGWNSPLTSLASAGDDLATTGAIWLDAICVTFDVTVHACAAYALGCRLHIIGVAGSWR
jgi:hypothetical protein